LDPKLTYWLAPEAVVAAPAVLAASAAAAAAPLLVSAVLPVAASPFITPLLASAELAAVDVSALPLSERLQPEAALNNTIAATISACLPALLLDSCFITPLLHRSAEPAAPFSERRPDRLTARAMPGAAFLHVDEIVSNGQHPLRAV
jgi:hypothetical protein